MYRAQLPFLFQPSLAVHELLGLDAGRVAVLAMRAVLRHNRSLDVAHQQVRYRGRDFAFSSRVTGSGDLVIDLDIGRPASQGRAGPGGRDAARRAEDARHRPRQLPAVTEGHSLTRRKSLASSAVPEIPAALAVV